MSGSIDIAAGARHHTWDALRPRKGDGTEMPLGGMGQGAVGPRESACQIGEYASEGEGEKRSPANCPAVRYGAAVG